MPTVAVCIGTCWTTAQIQRTQVPCMSHVEKHVDIVMLQVVSILHFLDTLFEDILDNYESWEKHILEKLASTV